MKYTITIPNQPDLIIDIALPKTIKNVGVMFSGGIDSTLVLSLLQLERLHQDFNLTAYTVENNAGYNFHCLGILEQEFYSAIKYVQNISNDGRFDGVIKTGIGNVLRLAEVDILFTGVNQNPPIALEGAPTRFSKTELTAIPKLRCPLVETTKDYIIQAYFQIPELANLDILKYTHSCTQRPRGHCGLCFQCKERMWAFAAIGQEIIYDN